MSSLDDILTDGLTDRARVSVVDGSEAMPPMTLPPLTVSALMVTKADLIEALRIYLPNISDLEAIEGDRFLLGVAGNPSGNEGA